MKVVSIFAFLAGIIFIFSFLFSGVNLLWSGKEVDGNIINEKTSWSYGGVDRGPKTSYTVEFIDLSGHSHQLEDMNNTSGFNTGPVKVIYDPSDPTNFIVYNINGSKYNILTEDLAKWLFIILGLGCFVLGFRLWKSKSTKS